jgi:hypothetical protein
MTGTTAVPTRPDAATGTIVGPREDRAALGVATLLERGMLLIVLAMAAGTLIALVAGITPVRDRLPPFDPFRMVSDALALRAEGFLWLGVMLAIGLPTVRVVVAGVVYARRGPASLARVALAILTVLGLSVALAFIAR